ncbi:MAG: dihydroorotase [Candidatus Dasytiphilus stammeri]
MFFSNKEELIIRRPDDWHIHLRENDLLKAVLPFTSSIFSRALVMPNIKNPIMNIHSAINYRNRIKKYLPKREDKKKIFEPLMTCYITENLELKQLVNGFKQGIFIAAKLYMANTTNNSSYGIKNIKKIMSILENMQKIGMPLSIHGEINDQTVDIYDRELIFIERILEPIQNKFPELKIVLEHISTKEAAEYVLKGNRYIAATITPQHLMFNRNHMLVNNINPHLYCLPILKKAIHQKFLRQVISSGCDRFFIGTDSAPHICEKKERYGYPGIFNAPVAIPAYVTVFEEMQALHYLEAFCSENGARFYGFPLNEEYIKIIRKSCKVDTSIKVNDNEVIVPFLAGKTLPWSIQL